MKYLHRFVLAALGAAFFMASAQAQNAGTVTNHAFVIGKGPGVQGYESLLCGSGQLAIGQSSASPLCKSLTGALALSPTGLATLPGGGALFASRTAAAGVDLSSFTVVETLGYSKPGDGGGARFYPRKTAITGTNLTGLGSGCTNGTWPGVKLTGGTGSGAQGTLVVSGGVVTSLNLSGTNGQGNGYTVGDVLTASPNNIHCTTNPQITVASVGNGPFLDSPVNSLTTTNAGAGCTPGTYYGLFPTGGFGGHLQGNAVIGGGGTLTSFTITGTGGSGYRVGDQLTFAATGVAAIPGCGTFPILTVAGTLAPSGSFTDFVGNNWQIIASSQINVLQFGAVADYVATETDGDATDSGPAMRAALRFAASGQPFGDSFGYSGNTVYVPSGAYKICNGLEVPQYVTFRGASFSGSMLKRCNSDAAGVHLITLGDPLNRQGTFAAHVWDMSLYGGTGAAGASYLIYSNSSQSGDAIARVAMYGVSQGCVKYETGYGGQSQFGIHSVICVPSPPSGSPSVMFDLSGNFGFTIDGQSILSNSSGTQPIGIRVGDGGFAAIIGFHCEGGVTTCISVNGAGSSPPKVRVVDGLGPATNFVVSETGSPIGNITLQNFVSNGTTCDLYNATTSTCLVTGDIPQTYPPPAIGSITGIGAGCATWLGTPSSANLRGCVTDETGTGALYFQGGDIGTPSAGVGTNLTSLNASNLASGTVPTARMPDYGAPSSTSSLTVTAGSGSLTTASATMRYQTRGKQTWFSLVVTITTNGTGATSIIVSGLPFTLGSDCVMPGRATAGSGKLLQGYAQSTTTAMTIWNYDNSYPAVSGEVMKLTGVCENT